MGQWDGLVSVKEWRDGTWSETLTLPCIDMHMGLCAHTHTYTHTHTHKHYLSLPASLEHCIPSLPIMSYAEERIEERRYSR